MVGFGNETPPAVRLDLYKQRGLRPGRDGEDGRLDIARRHGSVIQYLGIHRRLVPRKTAVVGASHKTRFCISKGDGGARTWRTVILFLSL